MGIFDFLFGKDPEVHELKGDECSRAGAFGDALIEYEKAIYRIDTRFPEKSHIRGRLEEKLARASNDLAAGHMENAAAMENAGEERDARELYELALDLAKDPALTREIERRMAGPVAAADSRAASTQASGGSIAGGSISGGLPSGSAGGASGASGDAGYYADDDDEYTEEDEQYDLGVFDILTNALPADLQEAYRGYGASFVAGYVALNEGDFEFAAGCLEDAMEENPGPNLIPLELATAYIHMGRQADAVGLLERFISQNPEQTRAYQLLCELYWEKQDFGQVDALLSSAPEKVRESKSLLLLLGENHYQRKDYDGAESVFQDLIDRHGKDEIGGRALAKTLEASGKTQAARDLYAEVINTCLSCGSRADPFLKRRYAELCYQEGETSTRLLQIYLGLAQEDADNRAVYFNRIAAILHSQGEVEEARRYEALAREAGAV